MKTIILLLLLFISTISYADNTSSLIIKQKSGNETTLEFSTNPVITFEGKDMVVTNDFIRISIPIDDITEYLVNQNVSEIKNISYNPQFSRGHVVFSGINKATPVYVYSLDGRIIRKQFSDNANNVDINMEELPKGAYIISTQKSKMKIVNK